MYWRRSRGTVRMKATGIVEKARIESLQAPYQSTFDDYAEMGTQK